MATPPAMLGIAGGHGAMGSLMARLFSADGIAVAVSDRDTPLGNTDLVEACDLTLVAVPLRDTPEVLSELAPRVAPSRALASLGSLMEPAVAALERCAGEAFLLHPLFGPNRERLRGASLAFASLRDGPRQRWLLEWLRARGAILVHTTPREHDRAMAVAQALLHGGYAALAPEVMRALPGDDPLVWATPTLRLQLALMSRILLQDPRLYGDLLALNRYTLEAIDALTSRLSSLRAAVAAGPDAVAAYFTAARAALDVHGAGLADIGNQALGE